MLALDFALFLSLLRYKPKASKRCLLSQAGSSKLLCHRELSPPKRVRGIRVTIYPPGSNDGRFQEEESRLQNKICAMAPMAPTTVFYRHPLSHIQYSTSGNQRTNTGNLSQTNFDLVIPWKPDRYRIKQQRREAKTYILDGGATAPWALSHSGSKPPSR